MAKAAIDNDDLTFTPATDATGSPYATFTFKVNDGEDESASAYTMTVNVTEVATLSALVLTQHGNAVALSPVFVSDVMAYRAKVANSVSSVTVTATRNDDGATVVITGDTDTDTPDTATFDLSVGSRTITVTVTDGSTTKTYTLTVERAALGEFELLLSAMLTVIGHFDLRGCAAIIPNGNCNSLSVLTEDEFTYDGDLYGIESLFSGGGSLFLEFVNAAAFTNGASKNWILRVDGTDFAFSSGRPNDHNLVWTSASVPDWSAVVSVSVSIFRTNAVPTASNVSVTTAQNTAYTFSADDFNFADDDTGDTLDKVKIVTLPGAGTLALNDTAVTADQEVTKADIDNGELTFTPVTDASGSPYTTFTFKVNDGTDESASAYTMTVNVTDATDATLRGLQLSQHGNPVALSPVFASDVTAYTATVANSVSSVSVSVTATESQTGATVSIMGDSDPGTPGRATFGLSVGSRTITVTATSADGNNTETYTLTVVREALGYLELLSSTLTVIENFGVFGCLGTAQDASCSDSFVLSEDDFTYAGDRYGIASLYSRSGSLILDFAGFTNAASKNWILRLDGTDFAFSSARPSGSTLTWTSGSVPGWSAGDSVSVRIFRAANAAPTASDGSVTTTENTAYPFSADDFNFADADTGDILDKVKIVTLPGAGMLALDGTPVTADQEVTKADIDGGDLTFTPAIDAIGSPYTTFTFKVNDGTDESAAAYTMTVNVVSETPTPDVLVSNIASTPTAEGLLNLRFSQAFTTGADPHGYKLSSVTVRVRGRSDSTRELRVDLYTTNSSNDPDDRIFRFERPESVPTGISNVTVNAPEGTRLDPGTTYHIVYTQGGGSGGNLSGVVTSSDAETGATGWTIANNGQYFEGGNTWINHQGSAAGSVSVEGATATDRPYVTSVTVEDAPLDGLGYETGEEITVSVTFSEAVDVTGTPRFPLQIGDSDRQAAYSASRESDTVLDFTYTMQASDHDTDGLEVPSNLFDLNGGSVKRASSTVNADLDKPSVSPGTAYSVNAVLLTGVAMESTAVNRYYTLGEHIEIGATFSEAVDVTGTPQLSFCVNRSSQDCNLVSADYNRGAGSAELVFRYTVKAGDDDNNGIWIGEDAISLNSGTISRSGTTEAAGLLHSALSTQGSHRVYHGPVVRSVEVTSMPQAAADTYGASEMIQFTVTFSEPVKVSSGRPHFEYSLGSSGNTVTREAAYESGSGTNALEFADTVLVDDNDDNGIWVGDNTDTIKLETGEYIRGVAGQANALLNHGHLRTLEGHKVNGSLTPPNLPPTATDGAVTTTENTAYPFSADDFNFADADTGDILDKVKIVTLPGAGTLELDGAEVTVNQEVTKADIDNGDLTFTPATDASGSPYTTFTFKVNDGEDESASAYTMTVNVTGASTDATLSALVLSQHGNAVALSPVFAGGVTSYTATVANSVSSVTVTATRNDDGATVAITGDSDTSTPDTATFDLSVGSRTITVTVTAADGNTTATYTLTVEREALGAYELLSSTLTARESFGFNGCSDLFSSGSRCESMSTLTENQFTYAGDTYRIAGLHVRNNRNELTLVFNTGGPFTNGAVNNWILRLDGTDFAFSAASRSGNELVWSGFTTDWSAGDPVSVRIFRTNVAPTASDGSVTTMQDTEYAFTADDFNFADDDTGDTLEKVKIVTLPDAGTLALDSTAVTANQEVTKANIDNGDLTFTPVTDASGSPYTTFTFKVNDGTDDSASAYTITVNVTEAPDATDATLSDLVLTQHGNDVALSPEFASDVIAYSATVANSVSSVTVTATKSQDGASVAITGDSDTATPDTATFNLSVGSRTITVTVTAADGNSTKTYTLTVEREALEEFELLSSTLTVREDFTLFGCSETFSSDNRCQSTSTLTEDQFTYAGDTYRITRLYVRNSRNELTLVFNTGGPFTNGAVNNWILRLDGTDFAFSAASRSGNELVWSGFTTDWSAGDPVSVRIFRTNVAPTASDGSVTTMQDTEYAFSADDFNFADDDTGDTLEKVKIVTLPGAGTLELDNTAVTANQEVIWDDIEDDKLTFTPATDATGSPYTTFTFKVNDGTDESVSAYTMTVNVTAPNGTDATLSALSLGSGVTLSPTFASDETEYRAWVANSVSSVTVTATKNDDDATVAITGDTDTSTPNTASISLDAGRNTIEVTVTAEDGSTTKTYTVVAVREAAAPTADPDALLTANVTAGEWSNGNLTGMSNPVYGYITEVNFTADGVMLRLSDLIFSGAVNDPNYGANKFTICFFGPRSPEQSLRNRLVLAIGSVDLPLSGMTQVTGNDSCYAQDRPSGLDKWEWGDVSVVKMSLENAPATGAPAITGTAAVGQTLTAAIGTIADIDGLPTTFPDDYTFQWVRVDGGVDTDITGATSSTYTLVSDDEDKNVKVKVSFTDDAGNAETLTSGEYPSSGTIGPLVANNPPVFSDSTLTRSIAENTAAGTAIGDVIPAATDADASDTLTYSMEGADEGSFDFDISTRQITTKTGVTYDHETKSSYEVTIKADDGNGGTDTVDVTISVTDVDEPPAAPAAPVVSATSGSTTSVDVNWTAPANTGKPDITGYDLRYCAGSATDCDADSDFTNGPQDVTGTSSAITGLDADTEYQVQVRATNSEGDSDWSPSATGRTNAVVITNNPPTASNGAVTTTENTAYTFTADDFNFADTDTGDTLDKVKIVTLPGAGTLRLNSTAVTANQEVTEAAIDDGDLTFTPVSGASGGRYATFTFKVNDGTDESAAAYTMTVNVTAAGALLSASLLPQDMGSGELGCSGSECTDTDVMSGNTFRHVTTDISITVIELDSGTLTVRFSPTLTVAQRDVLYFEIGGTRLLFKDAVKQSSLLHWTNSGLSWTVGTAVAMTVGANSAPAFPSDTLDRGVAENSGANVNVGAVIPAATDADASDTLTYSMEGTDAASFNFDVSTRQITTKTGVTYDHETKSSYSVTIKADDNNGGTDTVAVTISVTDVDEPPATPAAPNVSATSGSTTSLDVSWTAPANAGKPDITSYDLQYRQGASGSFTNGPQDVTGTSTAILSLNAGTEYQVQVRATNPEGDGGWSPSGTGSTNTPANNAPVFTDTSLTRSLAENTGANTNVGAVIPEAADADNDTLMYTLEGTDKDSFTFDTSTRQLKTKTGVTYDHESKSSYSVTIKADDNNGGTDTVAVTISVTDVDEPPATPAAPDVSATSGSTTSLDVSWTAPANAGKPDITSYDLRYRTGSASWSNGPQNVTGTSTAILSLNAGTEYQVQVRATNPEGDGGWSPSGTGSTNTPANNAPVFTDTSLTRSLAENTGANTNVGAVIPEAADADNDTLMYTLEGTDKDSFTFDTSTRQLKTKTGVTYDHETKSSYSVTIKADDGTASDTVAVTISVTDVDEPPATPAAPNVSATSGSTTSLDVSWTAPTNTGKPDITSYDLRYRTGSASWVNGPQNVTGTSTAILSLNAGTEYQVQVRATNPEGDGGWSPSGTGSTNTPANNAPVFTDTSLTRSLAENTGADANVGAVIPAATDDDSDTLSYSMEGTDAASFNFDVSTRQLKTKTGVTYDHESKSSYSVTIKADDNNGGTDTVAVTISVTDVDEPPSAPAAPVVSATSVTSVRATWTAPANTGPAITDYDYRYREQETTPGAWTAVTGTTITVLSAPITGLAENTGYDVQVRATNAEGTSDWSESGTGSTDANAAPLFTSSATFGAAENQTAAGTVQASDSDTGDSVTGYAIQGGADASKFSIVAATGVLTFTSAPNFESPTDAGTNNTYVVVVRASSGAGARVKTADQTITVTVTDVGGEAPSIPSKPTVSSASVSSLTATWAAPSNTGPAITDYDYRYREQETTPGAWTAVTGTTITALSATITGLAENTGYDVRVRATNAEGTSDWSESGTGSTDANNAPVFTDTSLTRSLSENTGANTNIGAVIPEAADADNDTLMYTLEGTDKDSFNFDVSSRQITTRTGITYDYETKSSYSVTIKADDGTASDTVAVTISVTDVSEPPTVPGAPGVQATAGSKTSLDVSWTAPANAGKPDITSYDLRYRTGSESWSNGPQNVTGTSTAITSLTVNTPYQVQVRATNPEGDSGWSASGTGSTAANNAPAFTDTSLTRSIAENTGANTNVGAVIPAASDDDSDTLSYSMEGTDAASFNFDVSTRQITTRTGVTYDHETKSSYSVTIKADDGFGGMASAAVAISVTDVNEPPATPAAPVVSATSGSTTSLNVSWAAPANAGKPDITSYDLRYRVGSAPWANGPQNVTGTSTTIPGLNAGTEYQVQVRATNAEGDSGWSVSGTGSTNTPTNSAPEFTDNTLTRSIAENTGANTNVGAVIPEAVDSDTTDTLIYSMEGADKDSFNFDVSSRQITTRTGITYDHEAKSSYSVTIKVSDGTASDTVAVTISITDVNEPPSAPAAPNVSATSGSTTSLDVSWTAPANAGKPDIASYDLRYRVGSAPWGNGPQNVTGTSTTITGLTADTEHQVQVRATNAEGDSSWSPSGTGRTNAPADMTPPDAEPGDLRLMEQRTVPGGGVMGRLEFFGSDVRSDAAWGTVCDDRQTDPGNLAPAVACRLMGYGGGRIASAPGNARTIHFDDQPIWLDDLVCLAGSTHWGDSPPTSLEECFHAGVGLHNCEHEEDLWVVCTGEPGDWTDATNLVGELPALSVASAGAAEHLHDKLVFTVSLVPAATMMVTVDYATSDGTAHDDSLPKAVAGEDYTAMNGTLTFAPGETKKTIEVPITDDDIEDSGEIMTLTLSNPAGAQFSRPVATGIIFNHEDNTPGDEEDTEVGTDSGPALTAALLDAPADGHGGSAFALTLRFSEEFPLSFRTLRDSALSVTNGTLTGVARTTAGENREWSLEVTPDGDTAVTVTLAAPADCAAADALCTGDDRPLSAAVSATVAATAQIQTVTAPAFRVWFEAVPGGHDGTSAVTFKVKFNKKPVDYSYVTMRDSTLRISQGGQGLTASRARRLNAPHNDQWEVTITPVSTADLMVSVGPAASCSATGAVCAADAEQLSNTVSATIQGPPGLSVADAQVEEGANATVDFTVTLSRAAAETVTLEYATADGTAVAGEDYTAAAGTLSFSPGQTTRTVPVAVLDDPHDEGSETFTLVLSNPSGNHAWLSAARATGTISNSDPLPKGWLARFGRTSATQVLGLLDARFGEARAPASQLTLGGRPVNLAVLSGGQADLTAGSVAAHTDPFAIPDPAAGRTAASPHALSGGAVNPAAGSAAPDADPFDALASRYTLDDTAWGMADLNSGPAALHADPSAGPDSAAGAGGTATLLERLAWKLLTRGGWSVDRRQFLSGSSFDLSLSALKGETDAEQAAVPAGAGHWSLWGRGALTRFAGRERGLSLDGDVLTGLLGLDYSRGRWLAGVGLAYNDGAGAYRAPDSGAVGKLDSTLVSVHPYLHYALTDRLSAWGTLGYGGGTLSLRPGRAGDAGNVGDGLKSVPGEFGKAGESGESGESDPIETGIGMRMGALGLRGTVFANAATELALKTDLMWVRTTSAATAGLAAVDGADASRVRLLLTGRHRHVLATGAALTPNFELGLRYDDGAAETGAGVELGGGLRYADAALGLSVEATARALLAHEAGGYEEWGLSGSLQLDPGRLGRGLSLRLASGWGLTDSSADALWQQQTASGLARGPGQTPQGRFLAEWGYGLDVPRTHGLLTPYGGVEMAADRRTLRLGWRFELKPEPGRRAS